MFYPTLVFLLFAVLVAFSGFRSWIEPRWAPSR